MFAHKCPQSVAVGDEDEKQSAKGLLAGQDFYDALRPAHAAGASYAEIGRVVRLTRQCVARIIREL